MDFASENHQKNIKTELLDESEESFDTNFKSIEILTTIKEEKHPYQSELISGDHVIYEHFPWDKDQIKVEPASETPIEYDENMVLKSEIDIGDSNLEIQNQTKPSRKTPQLKKYRRKGRKDLIHSRKQHPNKPKIEQHLCKFCMKSFISEQSLKRHTRQHPNELPRECRHCAMRFDNVEQVKRHEVNCTERRFECYVCRLSCSHWHWNRLIVHFRQHTGEKPFECKCCKKAFFCKRMLDHHMKYHPSEILMKCSFCKREFPTSCEAKDHESKCALKRQMECYLCKSTFTYKSSLQRHMPQHTGFMKFKCKYCQKAFSRTDFLNEHTKTHTQELQFDCTKCKRRFPQKTDLDDHKMTCTIKLFKCDLCNYSTMSKTYAEDHKQQHIGNDEFKCWHCPEVFLQRSKLVHHVKIHNKKIPFPCPYCQKPYQRWLLMEKHKQICANAPSTSKIIKIKHI